MFDWQCPYTALGPRASNSSTSTPPPANMFIDSSPSTIANTPVSSNPPSPLASASAPSFRPSTSTFNPLNPWTSQNLTYRALQDDPADKSFLYTLFSHPATFLLARDGLPHPPRQKADDEAWSRVLSSAILAVAISTNGSTIGILLLTHPPSSPSPLHRAATLSIALLPEHQRQGYGTESLAWCLDWSFRLAGLHRISLVVYGRNEVARRVYEGKLGFVCEGRDRDAVYWDRGWDDLVRYGMLESEWMAARRG